MSKPKKPAKKPTPPPFGEVPQLNDPPAPPATVALSPESLGVLAWIDKQHSSSLADKERLTALRASQIEAVKQTDKALADIDLEIRMAAASRFAVEQGARAHHGLSDAYKLLPDGSLSCLES